MILVISQVVHELGNANDVTLFVRRRLCKYLLGTEPKLWQRRPLLRYVKIDYRTIASFY